MEEALHSIWAKSDPFMSLEKHSLCTGICTEEFLSANSSRKIVDYLRDQFQMDSAAVISLISYLASVHDIGKIHPAFQRKNKECYHGLIQSIPEYFQDNVAETVNPHFRHEHYSAAVMMRIWKKSGIGAIDRRALAEILSLHHQKPGDRLSKIDPRNPLWMKLQDSLEKEMRDRFLRSSRISVPNHMDGCCMLISALIILMDWTASSDFFDEAERMNEKEIQVLAKNTFVLLGLISESVFPLVESFSDLFPFISSPRPLQSACSSLEKTAPLTIIEVPMGEGKTEAALYHAARICNSMHGRGIYMALPSQATSNQISARMNSMLKELNYGEARLLHGTAFLSQLVPERYETEDEETAAKWIRPSRMGFLGSNAVGTVDQAMAAVLRTRFSMLRLAGLANKVLIIDEIHAYDMYMSQIIEILLRWCRDLRIPVILLSATMQQAQKERYLSCFGAGYEQIKKDQYPMITQVLTGGSIGLYPVEAYDHYEFIVKPRRMPYNAEEIANMAVSAVREGGCLAILANTVGHAQEIYQALQTIKRQDTHILLFHGRFPLRRKAEIERHCVKLFGKDRIHRPERAILVATQVVEQSIDLDFDGMISELAPIDLLLQRAGRLHRHRGNSRPASLAEPALHVLLPADEESKNPEKRYGDSGFVYDPFLLRNTEEALSAERIIRIPEDIRGIVETVYSSVSDEIRNLWMKRNLRGLLETDKAKGCTWPEPEQDTFFPMESAMYYDISDPDDGFDVASEAATRLGDRQERIAFCSEKDYDQFKEHGVFASEQAEVYLNSVTVRLRPEDLSNHNDAYRIEKGKLSGIWILRGLNLVDLGRIKIINDPQLGVQLGGE